MHIYYPDGQLLVIMYFAIIGAILGMIFDAFKLKRVVFGTGSIVLFFDDLLFMLMSAVILVLCVFKVNSGRLRWYELAFTLFGFYLYRKTLSVIVVSAFVCIYSKIKCFVLFLLRPVFIIFNKVKSFVLCKFFKIFDRVCFEISKLKYVKKCVSVIK